MSHPELAAQDWYEEAVRWYVNKHQGCPWCGRANCLYQSERGRAMEYHCGTCDFFACHDLDTGRYFMGPGRMRPAPLTMHAI
jgi:hypothetical protein